MSLSHRNGAMKKTGVHVLIISFLIFLSSCSTLPLPGSPTESLFILAGSVDRFLIDKKSEDYQLVSVEMILRNIDTDETYDLTFLPDDDYITIPVEPGRYRIDNKLTIHFKRGKGTWSDERKVVAANYLIEKNVVFLSPDILQVERRNIGQGAYYSYRFGRTLNWNLKDQAMEDVFRQRRYLAWDLYQVIGWEPPEERDQ